MILLLFLAKKKTRDFLSSLYSEKHIDMARTEVERLN